MTSHSFDSCTPHLVVQRYHHLPTRFDANSLPRFTSDISSANLPLTTPTALGHLDQMRQGQQSTKRFVSLFPDTEKSTLETVSPITDNSINNHAYIHVFVLMETMHSDLTGKFLVTSFSGMQYLIISVLNGYVHVEPMKSRNHLKHIAAYKRTINIFSKLERKPIFQRLNNEISTALESFARSSGISIQYCAPHQHRALKAERATRTFKNHFIATLYTVAEDFPPELWDELLATTGRAVFEPSSSVSFQYQHFSICRTARWCI